jgi:tRNA (guanine-N7-)-methyltransferase
VIETNQQRRIRSFVRREGRMTRAQAVAIEKLWPLYGVEFTGEPLDFETLFGRMAPRVVEIGFGMGEALTAMAEAHPENNYLGVEVYRPGVGAALRNIHEKQLSNVRVVGHDAVEVFERSIPDHCLDAVYLFFPDPWPKKRHHKRRIIQPGFVKLVARKLKPGGRFHMATDWRHYAKHMMDVMSTSKDFVNVAGPGRFHPNRGERPPTKFERRGLNLGHEVWDLIFERRPVNETPKGGSTVSSRE